jgi:hypothetical protein
MLVGRKEGDSGFTWRDRELKDLDKEPTNLLIASGYAQAHTMGAPDILKTLSLILLFTQIAFFPFVYCLNIFSPRKGLIVPIIVDSYHGLRSLDLLSSP